MQIEDVPESLLNNMQKQSPVEIYDGDKVVAVMVDPELYHESYEYNLKELQKLCHKIGRRFENMDKEAIKSLMEIDDETYENLGLG